jgi:hypothetical protein
LYVNTHPPLYPVFLGGIYAIGGGPAAARAAQGALALATLVLVYLTAGRVFGGGAARVAVVAGAAYLPTAFYVTQLLSEILFTFFLVLGVYLLVAAPARGLRAWVTDGAAGAAFGAAGLTRGVALAAALTVALVLLARRDAPGRRWAPVVAFAAGVAVVVSAWSGYVYGETGQFVLVDTKTPDVLYRGNNPGTPMHHAWDIIGGSAGYVVPPEGLGPGCAHSLGRILGVAALKYMVTHPLQTALRFISKFADMWEVERCFVGSWRQGFLPRAPTPAVYFLIAAEVAASAAALALFWFAITLTGDSRWRAVTLAVVLSSAAAYALTIAHPRYHYPLMVLGAPVIGNFFADVLPRLRKGAIPRRRLLLASVPGAALALVWARMVWLFVTRAS